MLTPMLNRLRRLKKQVLTSVSSPSEDEMFAQAFDVFKTEFYRRSRERVTELSKARARLAESAEYQRSAIPFALRYKIYEEYVENVGNDFISALKNIVIPHCDNLTQLHIQTLQQEIRQTYARRLEDAKGSESAVAASIGRSNVAQSAHSPVETLYNSTASKFSELIQSTVKQAGLESQRKRLKERKERRLEITKELIKWGLTGGGIIYLGKLILENLGWVK